MKVKIFLMFVVLSLLAAAPAFADVGRYWYFHLCFCTNTSLFSEAYINEMNPTPTITSYETYEEWWQYHENIKRTKKIKNADGDVLSKEVFEFYEDEQGFERYTKTDGNNDGNYEEIYYSELDENKCWIKEELDHENDELDFVRNYEYEDDQIRQTDGEGNVTRKFYLNEEGNYEKLENKLDNQTITHTFHPDGSDYHPVESEVEGDHGSYSFNLSSRKSITMKLK